MVAAAEFHEDEYQLHISNENGTKNYKFSDECHLKVKWEKCEESKVYEVEIFDIQGEFKFTEIKSGGPYTIVEKCVDEENKYIITSKESIVPIILHASFPINRQQQEQQEKKIGDDKDELNFSKSYNLMMKKDFLMKTLKTGEYFEKTITIFDGEIKLEYSIRRLPIGNNIKDYGLFGLTIKCKTHDLSFKGYRPFRNGSICSVKGFLLEYTPSAFHKKLSNDNENEKESVLNITFNPDDSRPSYSAHQTIFIQDRENENDWSYDENLKEIIISKLGKPIDFTISSNDGGNFGIHKEILESKNIKQFFSSNEKNSGVIIGTFLNFNSKVVIRFIGYLYDIPKAVNGFEYDLFKIAENYSMEDLKQACIESLQKIISLENFYEIIAFANENNHDSLKKDCKAFFQMNDYNMDKSKLKIISADLLAYD